MEKQSFGVAPATMWRIRRVWQQEAMKRDKKEIEELRYQVLVLRWELESWEWWWRRGHQRPQEGLHEQDVRVGANVTDSGGFSYERLEQLSLASSDAETKKEEDKEEEEENQLAACEDDIEYADHDFDFDYEEEEEEEK